MSSDAYSADRAFCQWFITLVGRVMHDVKAAGWTSVPRGKRSSVPTVLRTGPYRFYFWSHELNDPHTFTWIAKSVRQSFGCSRFGWLAASGFGRTNCGKSKPLWWNIKLNSWRPAMGTLALAADERVAAVEITEDTLSVSLMDGRTICVPLVWYPRLVNASGAQRQNWQIAGGGYGIHWPEIDEDLSTEGLLRGAPAPRQGRLKKTTKKSPRRPQ